MPATCFSYPADVPPPIGNRDAARTVPPGLRRMPSTCFSYPADVPPRTGDRDAARTVPPGLRTMPTTSCFRY